MASSIFQVTMGSIDNAHAVETSSLVWCSTYPTAHPVVVCISPLDRSKTFFSRPIRRNLGPRGRPRVLSIARTRILRLYHPILGLYRLFTALQSQIVIPEISMQ